MKDDNELRRDVERELEWEPSVNERLIGVSVLDGLVTLTGEVTSNGTISVALPKRSFGT